MLDVTKTWAQLTEPASTGEIEVLRVVNHTFQVKVAAVDTSVDVRCEGSLEATPGADDWFNMDDSGADTTYVANGTYHLHKPNFTCRWVRFTFVKEAGGTAVTLDVKYLGMRNSG